MESLRDENEQLRLKVVAKQLDLDNITREMKNNSATPLMFAKEQSREDFWKLLTKQQTDMDEIFKQKEKNVLLKIQFEGKIKT